MFSRGLERVDSEGFLTRGKQIFVWTISQDACYSPGGAAV